MKRMTGEHKSHSDTTTNTACNQKQHGTKGNVSSLHVWGWIYVEMFPNFWVFISHSAGQYVRCKWKPSLNNVIVMI